LAYDISFSEAGGVEIEENWDKVKKITLSTGEPASTENLAPLLSMLPLELRADMESFIQGCFEVFTHILHLFIECKGLAWSLWPSADGSWLV
jgi:ATP citrate (pro-S)-lyase